MRKIKFFGLLAAILGLILLVGCGRSDVMLTVYEDGSITADVAYGIEKALMGNEEVKEQVKALITDSLDQNGIEYTEAETDKYVYIYVSRDFNDINELTSDEMWRGIGMVPKFSREQNDDALWVRYEDDRLKIDGVLDAAAFGAAELVSQDGGMGASFGGSLRVRFIENGLATPLLAESSNGELSEDIPITSAWEGGWYEWSGTADESVSVSLTSAPMPEAAAAIGKTDKDMSADDNPQPESSKGMGGSRIVTVVAVPILIIMVLIIAVVIAVKKRKSPAENDGDKKI